MKFTPTNIPEVVIIEPNVFGDDRGYFFESFNQKEFEENIGPVDFVQDNESKSSRGVLRGLHFQKPPFTQAKLVRCIEGEVLDVAVDLRKDSPTYKKYVSVLLTGENKKQLFVPRGFAHGFVVLSEKATFAYKVDNYYAPKHDTGIAWNDEQIAVDWQIPAQEVQLSGKDQLLKPLRETLVPEFGEEVMA
nr:dTDP-4-dehydrorhamnose 3,5-epimerase [uncultured Marinifilum sp.]